MPIVITLADYWMGRDRQYPADMTPKIAENAAAWVVNANALLVRIEAAKVPLVKHANGTMLSSGWRPPALNAKTPGASKTSFHMTGQAGDLFDPDGKIDAWCMANLEELARCNMWLEHPKDTPRWSHWQSHPPKSWNRVFGA